MHQKQVFLELKRQLPCQQLKRPHIHVFQKEEKATILAVTERGYGKRTEISEY